MNNSKCNNFKKTNILSLNKELKEFDSASSDKKETTFTFPNTIDLKPDWVAQRIKELNAPEEEPLQTPDHDFWKNFPKRRDEPCMNLFELYDPNKK